MKSGDTWIMNQHKQTGYFRRIEDNICSDLLAQNLVTITEEHNFCALDLEHEASLCYGDLGSAFTLYIDEVNTLVGVVSVFTNMCHRDYPVVFTKVAPYLDWIQEQTGVGVGSND